MPDLFSNSLPSEEYDASNIEVLEGLEAGEQVITSNYDSFGDAERIVLK